jgi:hypothetical protein
MMNKSLAALAHLPAHKMSPHAIVLMLDAAARMERAALGVDTPASRVSIATSTTSGAGEPESTTRVEVQVLHQQMMASLDSLVARMSPEQVDAGLAELRAEAVGAVAEIQAAAVAELNAALPVTPPQ